MLNALETNGAQIPFRLPLSSFESSRGYLLRATEVLGYGSPSVLTQFVGRRLNAIDNEDSIKRLAALLRLCPEEFAKHFYSNIDVGGAFMRRSFFGHAISLIFLNYASPRICPSCISQHPICAAQWDLTLVTACPIHGCELLDECPQCGKKLHWYRSAVAHCKCGFYLANAETRSVAPHVLALTKLIYRAVNSASMPTTDTIETKLFSNIQALPLNSLLRVIHCLGATFHPSSKHLTQLSYQRTNLSAAKEIVDVAGLTLSEWPIQYIEKLKAAAEQYRVDERYEKKVAHAFGNHYRHLYKVLVEPEFLFLKTTFEDFLNTEWDGLIRRQHRRFSEKVRDSQSWILASQATALLDYRVDVKSIRSLVKAGVLKGFVTAKGPRGRQEVWLERDGVKKWAKESVKWIRRPVAEEMLGVNYAIVMALAKAGLIKYQKGGVAGSLGYWNFLRRDVDRIAKAFAAFQVSEWTDMKTDKNIALQAALRNFLGKDKGLPQVVKAVVEGKLVPVGIAKQFKGILRYIFRRSDLRLYRPASIEPPEEGFLNLSEAAIALGVPRTIVVGLVRAEFLTSPTRNVFSVSHLIPYSDVTSFRDQYVFLSQLAREAGCGSVRVRNYLASVGIEGITIQLSGGTPITLYEKKAVLGVKIPITRYRGQQLKIPRVVEIGDHDYWREGAESRLS